MKVYSEAEQVKPNNKALTEQDLFKEGSAAAGQRVEKELIKQIAALMKVETAKVQKPQSLISLGMDSISVVLLKQAIEDFFSCSVEIATLFNSSAAELAEIIVDEISGEKSKETKADLTLPMLIPQIEGDHENFPLTDLQTAYWMGRNEGFELGGVAAHLYMEVTVTNADLDNNRLNQSWQKLIERHPMLRAVITQGGQQRILADNPVYEIVYHDLEHCSSTIQANECEAVRKKLRSQVIPVDTWPWFEIHHSKLSSEKSILHISIDLLIADIWSINLLFKEWYRLYLEPHAPLTELGINFRD
ncbi:MAG: condensation domain-containing protein, partial [Firmicutes bacterium]|nr:condensation domain-containing protein [Bacillota bacterium]